MKDVEKTSVERDNSSKRMRRRKRMMNVYGLIVVILVITAGVTICYTFLFNIDKIRVSGVSDEYTAQDIVDASGIKRGDNLLRLDRKKSEQAILDKLLYVETAVIDKKFPTGLEITVSACIPAFNVSYDNGVLLVSQKGKILADNGKRSLVQGLPIIYGYEPAENQPGKIITCENEHKAEAFRELTASIVADPEKNITSVDMSDEFSIIVNYGSGSVFRMGNWTDVEYKLDLAAAVMEDSSVKGKKGYLTMVGKNQCSFRTTDEPAEIPGTGINVPGTSPTQQSGENIPGQDEIFDEYNNRTTTQAVTDAPYDQGDQSYDGGYSDYDYSGGDDYGYGDEYGYSDDRNYDGYDYGYDYDYGQDYVG